MPGPRSAQPLTPEQLRSLVDTSRRARKIRRAGAVARFGGWTSAIFGALTLACLPFAFSAATLFIGGGLLAAAAGEFHGARLLSRLDARAPARLALNQLFLALVLVGYGAWQLVAGPSETAGFASGDPAMDQAFASLARLVHLGVYGTLIAVGVVAPGLTAWYYLSRARMLRELRDSAEPTMLEALKAA